jgi:hypothetical protein
VIHDKNIVLEFDVNKYESKSTIPNSSLTNSTQNLFESKSLNDMADVTTKIPKTPLLLKDRMLTIEEFYRQTPEQSIPGRSSRLSRKY